MSQVFNQRSSSEETQKFEPGVDLRPLEGWVVRYRNIFLIRSFRNFLHEPDFKKKRKKKWKE